MKKIKVKRNNWKVEVDKQISEKFKLRETLELERKKRESEYKMYSKNFHEMRKDKNWWIKILIISLILVFIALILIQKELISERDDTNMLISAGLNCQVNLNKCETQLNYIENKKAIEYFQQKYNLTIGSDCCYPVDCPEALNNPTICKCTYLVKCSGW